VKKHSLFGLLTAVLLALLYLAPPAQAQSMTLVGEVTVRFHTVVNIRSGDSTDHALIAKGQPGQIFPTTGQTAAGWYEIILPDYRFAYISPKLVYFRAFETPIQHDPAAPYRPVEVPKDPTPPPGASYPTNPNRIPGIPNLPEYQEYSYYDGELAVFAGPGTFYHRAAGGQATLGGGRIRVWGVENDWAMIGYDLTNGLYRIGYVPASHFPAALNLQPLDFAYREVTVISPAFLTDDPLVQPGWLFELPIGSKVVLLAYEAFADHWAYIETYYQGQPIRGFVNRVFLAEGPLPTPTPTPIPTQTPVPTPCPEETLHITGDGVLPNTVTFSFSGPPEAVYSGPGTNYHRAAGGRATVGGGRLRLWGTTGDWAMIGYGLSNNLYRIGYVPKSMLPPGACAPEIVFNTRGATITSTAPVNDDPIIHPVPLFELPEGTRVTLLAYETFANHWAYIETTFEGKPFRGFVNKTRLQPD
jgi:hypothetical protein